MDEDRVGIGLGIGMRAGKRLILAVAGNEGLYPRHQHEAGVRDGVFHSLQSAAQLLDVGERVAIANERIHLREGLVLDAYAARTAFVQVAGDKPSVVEIAEAAVAVDENGNAGSTSHTFHHIGHFAPGGLVGIAGRPRA
ncbi:hypothetical protein SAMN04488498_12668 [Mesorhizobium albiziae]|uniref:Uncharacterized protein n=1 Tax=Neomesorhizobium albiziae TaxID=335020 RepID=A0A1I4EM05_9HYPH|nr:hypothetical protein GCM10007937_37510 [Mesorhizobium albiziae]SFL05181.1 hypothetical protein SAMN04488498_12668 [Mesorhizobium albiziae]